MKSSLHSWALAPALARFAAMGLFAASILLPAALMAREDPLKYEIRISGLDKDEELSALQPLLERTLRSYRLKDRGAPSLALLRRRAEVDLETIEKVLKAEGRYGAEVSLSVAQAAPQEPTVVDFKVSAGRAYVLVKHRLEFLRTGAGGGSAVLKTKAGDGLDAQSLGSPLGSTARASEILAAEEKAVKQLTQTGWPFAELRERRVQARSDRHEIYVTSIIETGPFATFGPLSVRGAEDVDAGYIESYQTWKEGEVYDEAALGAFERALSKTGLFEVAAVERPQRGVVRRRGVAPIALQARAAPPRSVGLGARYSTDGGAEGRVSFEHRNLLGAGERLGAVVEGGGEDQSARLELRKPQFRRSGQEIVASISARRELSDAFDETAVDLGLGLERNIAIASGVSARAGLGLLLEASAIEDASEADGGASDENAYLLGLPAFIRVDERGDPLDPSDGYRLEAAMTPFFGQFDDSGVSFLVFDIRGAQYISLDAEARLVFAGRGRIASVFSEDLASVPSPRRLYSGGGGSVRGYAQRFVGPLDASGDPIGGRLALELGGELRWRPFDDFGFTAFVEAGAVSTELDLPEGDALRVGVGPGLRYFLPIGPVGVDIGLPIDPRPQDAPYQLYFFIGQAF